MKILDKLTDKQLVTKLFKGELAVIPTDTIYGVVAQASNPAAVEKLYRLKNRERKPGTVIASSIEQLVTLGIKRRYLIAVQQYWPNPISIEIPNSITYLNQGTGRQAYRIVADPKVIALLEITGPLLTTSANTPGHKPADTIDEARKYFGDKVGVYIDGGNLSGRQSSTLIRVVDDAVEVLRVGAVTIGDDGSIKSE